MEINYIFPTSYFIFKLKNNFISYMYIYIPINLFQCTIISLMFILTKFILFMVSLTILTLFIVSLAMVGLTINYLFFN